MEDDENILEFLRLQNERLNFHGDKMWEEMKHFSAVLYILLAAPFALHGTGLKENIWPIFFPLLAIIVAFIAVSIIHKESKDFLDALGTVLKIEKHLDFHKEGLVSEKRKTKLRENDSIEDFINRESCKCFTT